MIETERLFHDAPLTEAVDQERLGTFFELVEPVLPLAEQDHGEKQIGAPHEKGEGEDEREGEDKPFPMPMDPPRPIRLLQAFLPSRPL